MYCPAGQASQIGVPSVLAPYLPTGQPSHDDAPATDVWPTGQAAWSVPPVHMKPSEQLWHDEVPPTLYVPAEQSAHPEDPATVPILPAVQLLQLAAPGSASMALLAAI